MHRPPSPEVGRVAPLHTVRTRSGNLPERGRARASTDLPPPRSGCSGHRARRSARPGRAQDHRVPVPREGGQSGSGVAGAGLHAECRTTARMARGHARSPLATTRSPLPMPSAVVLPDAGRPPRIRVAAGSLHVGHNAMLSWFIPYSGVRQRHRDCGTEPRRRRRCLAENAYRGAACDVPSQISPSYAPSTGGADGSPRRRTFIADCAGSSTTTGCAAPGRAQHTAHRDHVIDLTPLVLAESSPADVRTADAPCAPRPCRHTGTVTVTPFTTYATARRVGNGADGV